MKVVIIMRKKITPKAIKKSWLTWFFWNGSSQQGENLLGNAVAHTMIPVIEELYETKEEKINAYERSLTLFNTEQQLGAIAPGILLGTEEAVANKEITPELSDAIKVALIGPVSAIGDSVWVATLIPLLLTMAMTVTNFGGAMLYIGPLLYMIGYPIMTAIVSWKMWNYGYSAGVEGIQKFRETGKLDQITSAVTVLGLIIIGALAASYVTLNIPITIIPPGGETAAVDVNEMINKIFPNILPLLLTFGVYGLFSKKRRSPLVIMGIILLIALALTAIGYLTKTFV